MWIARDKNGELYVYKHKPIRDEELGSFYAEKISEVFDRVWDDLDHLRDGFFPEVTWENSPKELVVKEEGKI